MSSSVHREKLDKEPLANLVYLDPVTVQAYLHLKHNEYHRVNKNYRFVPYPDEITLFRSQYDVDPKLNWQDLTDGKLVIHDIPGDHLGIMQEPNVQVLATHLDSILNADISVS